MVGVSLKLRLSDERALGPGKIRLLELIAETGSISAAGRAMKMSYRRAWSLVDELNHTFRKPVVVSRPGGAAGGGAALTAFGSEVVLHYRAIEGRIATSSRTHLAALERALPAKANRRSREVAPP
jgi:molybdate transport system regulatory protein